MADLTNLGFETQTVGGAGDADSWSRTTVSSAILVAGYLSEGGNLQNESEAFDDAAWTKIQCTISADVAANPPGLLYSSDADAVDALVDNGTTGTHYVFNRNADADGFSCTLSCYLKKVGTPDHAYLSLGTSSAWFDLSAGELGTVSGDGEATIEDLGSGWYLCTVSFPNNQTFLPGAIASIGAAATDGSTSYTGATEAVLHMYGAQVNVGLTRTPYVRTTGANIEARLKHAEDFELGWLGCETLHESLSEAGSVAFVLATYPTTTPPTTKSVETFEELWDTNHLYLFELTDPEEAIYNPLGI